MTWKVGDIVAEKRGSWYRASFGVVVKVTKTRVKVDFGEGMPNAYDPVTGRSMNQTRRSAGWMVRPLDAECRKDMKACGFAIGRCSPAELSRMERAARAFRQEVLGLVPSQGASGVGAVGGGAVGGGTTAAQ